MRILLSWLLATLFFAPFPARAEQLQSLQEITEPRELVEAMRQLTPEQLEEIRIELIAPPEPLTQPVLEPIATTIQGITEIPKIGCTICIADADGECAKRTTRTLCEGSDAVVAGDESPKSSTPSTGREVQHPVDERGFPRCAWREESAAQRGGACYSYQEACCATVCQAAEKPNKCIVESGRTSVSQRVSPSIVADIIEKHTNPALGGSCDPAKTHVRITGHGNSSAYATATVTACEVGSITGGGCQTFGLTTDVLPSDPWGSALAWARRMAEQNKSVNVCGNQLTSLAGSVCQASSSQVCIRVSPQGRVTVSPALCANASSTVGGSATCAVVTGDNSYAFCDVGGGSEFTRYRLGCQKCVFDFDGSAGFSTRPFYMGHWEPADREECCAASGNSPSEFCEAQLRTEERYRPENHWGCCVNQTNGNISYSLIENGQCSNGGTERRENRIDNDEVTSRPMSRYECRALQGYCCVYADSVISTETTVDCTARGGVIPFPEETPSAGNFCPLTQASISGDPYICCSDGGSGGNFWLYESECKSRFRATECSQSCNTEGAGQNRCCRVNANNDFSCEFRQHRGWCTFYAQSRFGDVPRFCTQMYGEDCTRAGGVQNYSSACAQPESISRAMTCCHIPLTAGDSQSAISTIPRYMSIQECLSQPGATGVYAANDSSCQRSAGAICCERSDRGRTWRTWGSPEDCRTGEMLPLVVSRQTCEA